MSGKEVGSFEWRKTSKEGPKSIKFSKDEKYCARLATMRSIEIFEDGDFSQAKFKLVAGPHLLPKKKNEGEDSKKKEEFKFDGFELVP